MHVLRPFFILSSSLLRFVTAKIINVTVDDQYGDPSNGRKIQYFPGTAWQIGNGCAPCTAKPTPASEAHMGTWYDATFNPNDTATNSALGQIISATAQFTGGLYIQELKRTVDPGVLNQGTAVYVNCILTRSFTSPDGNTDMTFYLDNDDTPAGIFQQSPNGDASYRFNQVVFSKTDLPFGEHTVRLEAGHAGLKALVLLDSIIYTTEDDPSSQIATSSNAVSASATDQLGRATTTAKAASAKSTNMGVIIGPIIAAMVVVVGLIVTVLFCHVRKRRIIVQKERSLLQDSSVVSTAPSAGLSAVAMVNSPMRVTHNKAASKQSLRPLPSAPSWPDSSRSS